MAVQFVISVALSTVVPIMPLFLPDPGREIRGVVSAGAIDIWSGVPASATSRVAIFAAPVRGGLADWHGGKPMVPRSTLGIAVVTLLMAIARNPRQTPGSARRHGRAGGISFRLHRDHRITGAGAVTARADARERLSDTPAAVGVGLGWSWW